MARRNWMPRSYPKRAKLLAHLDEHLIYYKDDLEISQTVLDKVHNCNLMFAYVLQNKKNAATFLKSINSYFNDLNEGNSGLNMDVLPKLTYTGVEPEIVPSNIFAFIRELRRTLMNCDKYTEGTGLALMFYGTEINFNKDKYKPTIKVIVRGNKIRIVTSVIDVKIHQVKMKIGKSKGYVNGEKIAGASEEFEIPIDTKNVGIPVSIKIVGIIKGNEIGKESDVVEILYMSKNDSRK
jgi:hypothetical protein